MVTIKRNSPRLRDNVETIAVFYACRAGYYDTRQDFHRNEKRPHVLLRRRRLFLPLGATHRFAIQVDQNRYVVTRYEDNWVVDCDDKTAAQKRERLLRKGALYKALHHFAESLQVPLKNGDEDHFIDKLLKDEGLYDEGIIGISGHHPIVRDESPAKNMRQWAVIIGTHHCQIALVNKGTPQSEFIIL